MLKCLIYLAAMGIISFLLGRMLPYHWLDEAKFPFKIFAVERDGKIYEKIGVRKWQNKIPDMSKIVPNLMPAKQLNGNVPGKLPVMIKETCVAELIHVLLGIAGLYCLVLWKGMGGIWMTILYEIGNLPFIVVQRYNRPRMVKLLDSYRRRGLCEH